jgi:hypothetical protein
MSTNRFCRICVNSLTEFEFDIKLNKLVLTAYFAGSRDSRYKIPGLQEQWRLSKISEDEATRKRWSKEIQRNRTNTSRNGFR